MDNSQKRYSRSERRKSFWAWFLTPLPERRAHRVYIKSLKKRIAVTFIIAVTVAIGCAVALDKTAYYFKSKKQYFEINHIVFAVNPAVVQHFNEAVDYLAALEQISLVLNSFCQTT